MRLRFTDKVARCRSGEEEEETQSNDRWQGVSFSTVDFINPPVIHFNQLKAMNARNAEFWRSK